MGDIGAVATFLDDLFRYFAMDPNGYARLSVERQLEALRNASNQALDDRDWAAYDRCIAEYRRLQATT
jgi:hypothetical protein